VPSGNLRTVGNNSRNQALEHHLKSVADEVADMVHQSSRDVPTPGRLLAEGVVDDLDRDAAIQARVARAIDASWRWSVCLRWEQSGIVDEYTHRCDGSSGRDVAWSWRS